jgi:hypothetical protein
LCSAIRIGASLIVSGVPILTSSSSAARGRHGRAAAPAPPSPKTCNARRLFILSVLPGGIVAKQLLGKKVQRVWGCAATRLVGEVIQISRESRSNV